MYRNKEQHHRKFYQQLLKNRRDELAVYEEGEIPFSFFPPAYRESNRYNRYNGYIDRDVDGDVDVDRDGDRHGDIERRREERKRRVGEKEKKETEFQRQREEEIKKEKQENRGDRASLSFLEDKRESNLAFLHSIVDKHDTIGSYLYLSLSVSICLSLSLSISICLYLYLSICTSIHLVSILIYP